MANPNSLLDREQIPHFSVTLAPAPQQPQVPGATPSLAIGNSAGAGGDPVHGDVHMLGSGAGGDSVQLRLAMGTPLELSART